MTIDWERFAERVPAGTQILGQWYHGIILENQSYGVDEIAAGLESHRVMRRYKRDLKGAFMLRVQLFTHPMAIPIDVTGSQFLINGQWLTFAEVMALP